MIHSEFLFFDLIKLYKNTTDEDSVNLKRLEEAFYTLESLISDGIGIYLDYVFEEELEKLESVHDDLFVIDEDCIGFIDVDIDFIENELLRSYTDEEVRLDAAIPEFVYNICIYHALGIDPPLNEYEELFNDNATVIQNYLMLAYQENQNGFISKYSFMMLKAFREYLEHQLNGLKVLDVAKVNAVAAHYNNLFLLDSDSDYVNANWYVVLFGKSENQMKSLYYDRIYHFVNEEYGYDEEEEEVTSEDIPREATYIDEVDFFVHYFTILFKDYLLLLDKGSVKDILTTKKYLLIAISPKLEEYYLETGSIDDLDFPPLKKEWLTDTSFNYFYLIAVEQLSSFLCKDADIQDEVQADMITSALFIKAFLNLCINEEMRKDIQDRIIYSAFYKNPDYSFATSLVDDIIFKEKGLELNRNTTC